MEYILAHDFGTSGVKACLFDRSGQFYADACFNYDTYYQKEGYVEQDPEAWWESMKLASRYVIEKAGVNSSDIAVVSFSAHGSAIVPVDKNGDALLKLAPIWNDSRSYKEGKEIINHLGQREHYRMTGRSMDLSISTCAKYYWIKKNLPDVYEKTYKFLGAKEFMIYKMTGRFGYTEPTEHSSSGMYNLISGELVDDVMKITGLDKEKFCEAVDPTTIVGTVRKDAAEELDIKEGIPVVIGSWDNFACATGAGTWSGDMVLYLGTAGWFGISSNEPLFIEDATPNIVKSTKKTYFTSFHSHSACSAYDWVINNMCTDIANLDNSREVAEELASKVAVGSDKLMFLPSMFTGNSFFSNSALCGTFAGIKMTHGKGHIIRAALEGPVFDLMMGAEALREKKGISSKCTIIGGGAKNNLWVQICADMIGIPMVRPKNPQHIGALGAAMFGCIGTGLVEKFDSFKYAMETDDITYPIEENHKKYSTLLPEFKAIYESMIPIYERLQ